MAVWADVKMVYYATKGERRATAEQKQFSGSGTFKGPVPSNDAAGIYSKSYTEGSLKHSNSNSCLQLSNSNS